MNDQNNVQKIIRIHIIYRLRTKKRLSQWTYKSFPVTFIEFTLAQKYSYNIVADSLELPSIILYNIKRTSLPNYPLRRVICNS